MFQLLLLLSNYIKHKREKENFGSLFFMLFSGIGGGDNKKESDIIGLSIVLCATISEVGVGHTHYLARWACTKQ